jgi:hypothetical protein
MEYSVQISSSLQFYALHRSRSAINKNGQHATGRYMQLASTGFCAPVRQTGTPKPVGALSARLSGRSRRAKTIARCGLAPLPQGPPSWCHSFCQRDNRQNNIITLHRTTSAKTRATATLRQRHIPLTVRVTSVLFNIIRVKCSNSFNWGASFSSRFEKTRQPAIT